MNQSRLSTRFRLAALAALLIPVGLMQPASAQDAPLTIATWGGAYTDALTEGGVLIPSRRKPAPRSSSWTPRVASMPCSEAQADADNVTWDIVDVGEEDAVAMIDAGLLRPLPEDLRAELIEAVGEENVTEYGVSFASYGSVIVCNAAAAEACPTTAAELWDVENFPDAAPCMGMAGART